MKIRRPARIVATLLGTLLVFGWLFARSGATVVLVVRHAEKADTSANTDLSAEGLERAQALVEVVSDLDLAAVYSTEFCRTAQTAQPSAISQGLPIRVPDRTSDVADIRACEPPITAAVLMQPGELDDSERLADHIRSAHGGQTVLVAGHSNTVPEIVATLMPSSFAGFTIVEEEFHRLFRVTIPRFGEPRLVETSYGN